LSTELSPASTVTGFQEQAKFGTKSEQSSKAPTEEELPEGEETLPEKEDELPLPSEEEEISGFGGSSKPEVQEKSTAAAKGARQGKSFVIFMNIQYNLAASALSSHEL